MSMLSRVLQILGVVFIAVALLHLVMGEGADAMLGSPISHEMAAQPSFDSQNRFYGVSFSLLGIALLISATDLRRYQPIVLATLGVLFAAGLGRAIAWVIHGAPAPLLIVILVVDLLLPPLLFVWLKKELSGRPSSLSGSKSR